MRLQPLHVIPARALLFVLLVLGVNSAKAQSVTDTIWATGTTGSYITGSVNSSGTKNDGLMTTINSSTNRGWAVFDLSNIPTGSVINSSTVVFTTTSSSVLSSATNFVGGYAWTSANDPATVSGSTLYTLLNTTSTNAFNASTWSVGAAQVKTLNAAGSTFLANNFGGKVVMSFVRGSTNTYHIFGYDAATSTQRPYLIINYTPSVPCSGAPNAGTAVASAAAICPTASSNLSLTGVSAASGLTYQWESSPAGANTWTPIANATTATYTVSGLSAATDYHAVVTCTNGGGSSASTTVTVSPNPFYNCYCASGATSTGDEEIYSVTVNGTNSNTFASMGNGCTTVAPGPGSLLNRYSNFKSLGTFVQMMQGSLATFTVEENECDGATYYAFGTAIWIDWNQNGDFNDVGEKVFVENSTATGPRNVTGSFLVPATAVAGQTAMRVTVAEGYSGASLTPCLSYGYGETEDYLVEVVVPTPCSGNPNTAIASAPASLCPNLTFNLTASNLTTGTGISYQWQSSPTGLGSWTSITGATDPFYTVTGGITSATDYQLVTTCSNGGGQSVSNTVTVNVNPFFACYCSPNNGTNLNSGFASNYISSVSIPGTTLNNPTTTAPGNGYNLFYPSTTTTTANLTQGVQYTINTTIPYSGYYMAAWIDYDQNGTFDVSEHIPLTVTGTNGTATFIVPLTATPGQTGMRLRVYWQNYTAGQACATFMDYETEDYVITIDQALPCSGQPNVAAATGPASVCSGSNFSLSASGFSTGLGITYQWEMYDNGTSSWVAITGATNPSHTVTGGISAQTDFRFVTTCSNGGGQDVSNTVTVATNPFFLCYCSPNTGTTLNSGFASNYISSVSIPGTTLNNPTTTTTANGYHLFYPSTASTTANLTQGVQYTINTTIPFTGYYMAAWIDYDQSGTYDASEHIPLTVTGTNGTASFIVPLTATPGQTGMRLRVYWQNYTAGQACATFMDYETEEYVITIDQALPCSGQPNVATATGPASICSGANFTLAASGFSTGIGITYQWEMYDNATTSWVPVTGATNPSYTVSGGIISATDYRFVTTCSNGGGQDVSNTVSVAMAPFYSCYCASGATSTSDEEIYSVTINGTNSNTLSGQGNGCTQVAPGPGSIQNRYSNFSTLGPISSGMQGSTVTFTVEENECDGPTYYSFGTAIWVDWNQNGSFNDPGEKVFVENTTATGPRNVTGSFLVPATAVPGQTGMRVTVAEGYSGTTLTPCLSYGYGETEDYVFEVTVPAPCSGTPATPVATGPSAICPNVTFTLSATGMTVASGISYQWESTASGTTNWAAITGATDPVYTVTGGITSSTDYRLVTTCAANSAQSFSNTIATAVNAPTQCYCTPPSTNPNFSDHIMNVTFGGINNSTGAGAANGYNDFTGSVAAAQVTQGMTYTASMTIANGGTEYGGIWIDWDQNGVFDASEFTNMGSGANPTALTQSITVPANAVTGTTRMRVRSKYGAALGSNDACAGYTYGETEDYAVFVSPSAPPANNNASGAFVINLGATCTGNSYTNVLATHDIGEPSTSCVAGSGYRSVWYMFTAPASGAVRISTDFAGSTLTDTRVALFSATNPADYTTFSVIACDDNNGSVTGRSLLYATGLTSGTTYYIEVDGASLTGQGTFCMEVTELSSSMLSVGGACATGKTNTVDPNYTGWTSLVDNTGALIANVQATTPGNAGTYNPGVNKNTGAVRSAGTIYYLDRNYLINGPAAAAHNVQFFFTDAEFNAMQTAAGSGALSNVNVTRQTGTTCQANFDNANGSSSLLAQTGNGTVNGAYWVTANTPGFSNFYLHFGSTPLVAELGDITAVNVGNRNRVDWNTLTEQNGDRFEVERSTNGADFTKIGAVSGKGRAAAYSFWDNEPVTGVNYYRLKMVDVSGDYAYSQIVTATVRAANSFGIEAYPNPVTNNTVTINVYGAIGANALISVSDVTGKVIRMIDVKSNAVAIDMTGLAAGVYLVKYSDNTNTESIKINKQ